MPVLYMDLDNFKVVNDSLGHEVGDRLLVAVGERIRGSLRPEDTLARFGGDEFTALVENVEDPTDAVRVAERIMEAHREPFVLEGQQISDIHQALHRHLLGRDSHYILSRGDVKGRRHGHVPGQERRPGVPGVRAGHV